MVIGWSASGQQISIGRIDMMPSLPEPYHMRDWKKVAHQYDSLVFVTSLSGQYLPLIAINESGVNYPEHKSAALVSYVGKTLGTSAEGINYIPAIIGATLCGINKSNQFGEDWVLMAEDFFNKKPSENIYLNNYSSSSGHDWWYETMPNIFFYQLNDLYPNTGDFNYQFQTIAHRWLEAVDSMGGNTTPWSIPYMNYRAWSLKQMKPLTEGVKQPEAAGAIAWILYHAYTITKDKNYLIGAEWALEFLNNWQQNPSYELQLPYGVYVAARMNAEIGTDYDIDKMLNWCFDRGALRGWGTIVGKWGNYDCSGLIGEANDAGNDYAFIMNGFQQVGALVPMLRYNENYANAIGKWVLNVANASRLFYPGFLPNDQQDSEEWSFSYDPDSCISHEAMKEILNDKSPFSTGDAIRGGWAPTNLALYGASHVGYFGGIIESTNVKKILKLDLCKTDFYGSSYPTYLLWNPYDKDTTVSINVGEMAIDIYNSLDNNFSHNSVSNIVEFTLPAYNSVILVYVPTSAIISKSGKKTFADSIVIDFDNGEIISDHPPRIKALKALYNPIAANETNKIYCTAQDIDNDEINYEWYLDGISQQGDSILSIQVSEPGMVEITCIVSSGTGLSDSSSIVVEVKERIPHIPEILSLKANPGKIDISESTTISCEVYEENGDELTYVWAANDGVISGSGDEIQWTSPATTGDYQISCKVSDIDGQTSDSFLIMVRDLDGLDKGEPLLLLPFNGNVEDYSMHRQITSSLNISYATDAFDNPQSAAYFNGSSSYVRIVNNEQLNFKSGLTLSGWIYSQHEAGGEAYPISHGNWENRWKISISNNTLRFTVKTNQGIKDLDTKSLLMNEEWYYFTTVYTGSDMEIYINGQLDSFIPFSGDIGSTDYDLILGKARPDQDYHYKGRLDDIYLFDHPLSPTHIKEMYEAGVSLKQITDPDLSINAFPNPVTNILYVDLGSLPQGAVNYQISNPLGRVEIYGSAINSTESLLDIDINGLLPGFYILKVGAGKVIATKKILIIK